MKQNLLILAIILGSIALYTAHEGREAIWADNKPGLEANDPITERETPDFSFTSLGGASYSLSDFKGKVIVLNFWASWCAPCLVEFPQMLELAEAKKDKAVFIFMSVDEDKKNIDRFLKKMGKKTGLKNVIIGHDHDKSISQTLFQTYKLPETYLIDSQFKLREKVIGIVPWNDAAMKSKIDSLYSD